MLEAYKARGTGYFPSTDPLEGGFFDRRGKPLNTLQEYLDGKADYVTVATDVHAFPYGTWLCIPELDAHFDMPIRFEVRDTGEAFVGKGTSRIDICTADKKASEDEAVNGELTLIVVKRP